MVQSIPLTPRRSNRFKPFLQSNSHSSKSGTQYCWSTAQPVFERPTIREDLFELDERDKWDEEHEHDDDDEEENQDTRKTYFYLGFGQKAPGQQNKLVRDAEVYKIGDTVIINSDRKDFSIGVIAAMWETSGSPIEKDEDEDDEEDDEANPETHMKVRIRWFLRPKQLAAVRAKREHKLVRFLHFPLPFIRLLLYPERGLLLVGLKRYYISISNPEPLCRIFSTERDCTANSDSIL